MKSVTRILIAVLVITSLIPIKIGMLCFFDQSKALEFFGMELLSQDVEKIFFVLGGFMLASIALPVLSIVWLIRQKEEGYVLAYITGLVSFIRGALTLFNFSTHNLGETKLIATPMVIGFVIVMLTYVALNQHREKC